MDYLPRSAALVLAAILLALTAAACDDDGGGAREITITQRDSGCDPTSVQVSPGQTVKLTVTNASGYELYEIQGSAGLDLDEFVVPKGETRERTITIAEGARAQTLDCYVPSGPSTSVQFVTGLENPTAPSDVINTRAAEVQTPGPVTPQPTADGAQPTDAIGVSLLEYTITLSKPTANAGRVQFIATNTSASQTHTMAVMQVQPDGAFQVMAETDGIRPQQGGSLILDLTPGLYKVICTVQAGEYGSTSNHLQQGMQTDFTVQ